VLRLILFRTAQGLVSLWAVTVMLFIITRITGDPVKVLLPPEASREMYDQVRRSIGLDRPLIVQYMTYLGDLLQGNLGTSFQSQLPVSQMIANRIPATLELGGAALLVTFVVGLPLGLYAGYRRGKIVDRIASLLAVLGQAAPTFWIGILAILVLAVHLGLLPAGGRGGISHLILPAVTMAWASVAGVTRLMRSSVLETLESDYIRLCRVKGMSESRVLWKHALRNAALPVLTFGGVVTAGMMTGSVVTEAVFVWPGTGRLLLDAIGARDFPVVQGVVLVLAGVYIVINIAVDIFYAYLNPRLRVTS
jgi:peptide/nickel transport system permease protein